MYAFVYVTLLGVLGLCQVFLVKPNKVSDYMSTNIIIHLASGMLSIVIISCTRSPFFLPVCFCSFPFHTFCLFVF